MQATLGIAVLSGIAWLPLEDRQSVDWRAVEVSLIMPLGLALVLVVLVSPTLSAVELGGAALRLEGVMGWIFAPVAYLNLAAIPGFALVADSWLIMTHSLCGFASFSSLGILRSGLGRLIAKRRQELLQTAPRALTSGMLLGCLTVAIVVLVMLRW